MRTVPRSRSAPPSCTPTSSRRTARRASTPTPSAPWSLPCAPRSRRHHLHHHRSPYCLPRTSSGWRLSPPGLRRRSPTSPPSPSPRRAQPRPPSSSSTRGIILECAVWSMDYVPAFLAAPTLHQNVRILIEPETEYPQQLSPSANISPPSSAQRASLRRSSTTATTTRYGPSSQPRSPTASRPASASKTSPSIAPVPSPTTQR